MSGDIATGVILALIYFGGLVVVALEPHEPDRQGKHRRYQLAGAP